MGELDTFENTNHGRSKSLRINIQQNIFNVASTKKSKSKSTKTLKLNTKKTKQKQNKSKKGKKNKLKLTKNQHSAPELTLDDNEGNIESLDDGILCIVDTKDIQTKPQKVNIRRKRSNSYSAESPRKRKASHDDIQFIN